MFQEKGVLCKLTWHAVCLQAMSLEINSNDGFKREHEESRSSIKRIMSPLS